MTEPKAEIIWRKENPEDGRSDYESSDGRWHIIHAKRSKSGRWELYDNSTTQWHGDWFSLTEAKNKARLVQRLGGSGRAL